MRLTFCYLAPTVFTRFSITVSHFNKHEISFSKWYSTFFYLEYFRSDSKKSTKGPKQFLQNFAILFSKMIFPQNGIFHLSNQVFHHWFWIRTVFWALTLLVFIKYTFLMAIFHVTKVLKSSLWWKSLLSMFLTSISNYGSIIQK